ncbi:hypothetical protein KP509_11G097200 [Ceratopteris richardii]|uniref:Uncharacterized protein n=1 Tax=Ceratopteris richardii TaxID=49495 RepID=A0A8T2TXM4_CERRI|nr:hypothetical protein KP509_11G097200 [Ceratopteris richardii]
MDSSKSTEKHSYVWNSIKRLISSTLQANTQTVVLNSKDSIKRLISATLEANTQTVVLNSTCLTMALRKKHRDVWEGLTFTIAPGESLLVRWTTLDPWERLGAMVMSDTTKSSRAQSCALLISVHTLASSSIVSILHSSNSLEAHSVPRPESNP